MDIYALLVVQLLEYLPSTSRTWFLFSVGSYKVYGEQMWSRTRFSKFFFIHYHQHRLIRAELIYFMV